jgi:hypothetical protein
MSVAIVNSGLRTPITQRLTYISPSMIRIAISLAAYQALASTMPEGTARPPEPLEDRSRLGDSGEGVGLWIDHVTLAALRRERRGGEGWSEVILRVAADVAR